MRRTSREKNSPFFVATFNYLEILLFYTGDEVRREPPFRLMTSTRTASADASGRDGLHG